MIQIRSIVLTTALLGHASAQGCHPAYVTGVSYSAGDMVSATTTAESTSIESCTPGTELCPSSGFRTTTTTTSETHNYECKSEPSSQFCSQSVFAPNGIFSGQAWIKESAECTGNASVTPATVPVPAAWGDGGCPNAFVSGADYAAAEIVSVQRTGFKMVYQCANEPTNLFCGMAGYEPTDGLYADQAWTALGSCSGTIAPTSSPNFVSLDDVGGCPGEYDSGVEYMEGDKISNNRVVYQCKSFPLSQRCSQIGYEPGNSIGSGAQAVEFWRKAWSVVGSCSGSIAPTSSPVFVSLTDVVGCPDEWSQQTYEEGDRVSSMKLVFECKADPLSSHCGQAGYEPNTDAAAPDAWKVAWTVVGHCSGSIGPTGAPSFDPANSVGGCPDEWEMGSSASYEEGDMVSVTISTMPLRQVAYRCNAWPLSGHCGQISPIEDGGDLGWTFAGSCDGSIGPTASPSFDALTVDASGCPEEWSASKTDYEAGDRVSYSVSDSPSRKLLYQCREWPNAGYCNLGEGFEPTTLYGEQAWTLIGACSGTLAPTGSPVQYDGMCQFIKCVVVETVETNCVPGSAGCSCLAGFPAGINCRNIIRTDQCTPRDVDLWSNNVEYVENDVVRLGAKQFRCRGWPEFLWCRSEAYRPTMDDNGIWTQAWTAIEDCPP